MLTFRQLEAFRAVMDAGSAVGASAGLGLSQPAISRLLTDLEAAVGFRLFKRRKGRLEPLDAARDFYAEVDRSFVGLNRIAEAAERIGRRTSTTLRIAALPALIDGPLSIVVSEFLSNRKDVFLTLESRTRYQIVEELQLGIHDIGFASLPLDSPGIVTRSLASSDCVCVVPADHPLQAKSVITPADLDGVDIIMQADRTPMRQALENALADADSHPVIRAEVTTAQAGRNLIKAGVGVCVSVKIVHEYAIGPDFRMIPFVPNLTSEIALLHAKGRPPVGLAQEFIESYARTAAASGNSCPSPQEACVSVK